MIVTQTVKIEEHRDMLALLHTRAFLVVRKMLADRTLHSTKDYPELPSVIVKSLIRKYQRNPKCHSVKSLVLPICGDKGRQVKMVEGGIRIPVIFKKILIHVIWRYAVNGYIRSVEIYARGGDWFVSVSYDTVSEEVYEPTGCVGVDRNSLGNVAVMSDPATGKVEHLGFNPARTKEVWRGRKARLQKEGKNRLLYRIKRKQSKQTKLQDHIVSKTIVDYAATHRRAIALEKLAGVTKKGSRIRRYSQGAQWSFAQLESFIRYKAALRGVTVISVPPEYTSQECSRCGERQKPDGKRYLCGACGHNDHRDANAGFVIAKRGNGILHGGVSKDSVRLRRGLLVAPFSGHAHATV